MEGKYLAIFLCLFSTVYTNEVAVVMGGQYWSSPITPNHLLNTVEVYTSHLTKDKQLCKNTNKEPDVPNLPIPIYGASAVFLPDFGIFLCGGMSENSEYVTTCYRYDPRVSRYLVRFYFKPSLQEYFAKKIIFR